jgi:predicted TPR repeat methyltransferase
MLYTEHYQQLLINEHIRRPWGVEGQTHHARILELYHEYHCDSILDYGCGQGLLSQRIGNLVTVVNYDPGIPAYTHLPLPADLVVCADVLEHIEPECLHHVLTHIHSVTVNVAFFTICSIASKSTFPDGQNLHLIQQDQSWWLDQLSQYFNIIQHTNSLVATPK